jgi:L-asparaginase
LKSLLILYPGGTIGCIGNPLAPMSGKDFEAALRRIVLPIVQNEYPELKDVGFHAFNPAIDSTNAKPSNWCDIAESILQNYLQYDAFVVLHGTDTMAWAASALSFLLPGLDKDGSPLMPLSKPVVVTGSQLPLFAEGEQAELALRFNTDALENFCGAIQSCAQMQAGLVPIQVGLYFARHLMRGNRATKIDTDGFSAFGSPNHAVLAESGIYSISASASSNPSDEGQTLALEAVMAQNRAVQQQLSSGQTCVAIVQAFPAEPDLFAEMLKPTLALPWVKAVIFEGFGAGNFPAQPFLQDVFKKAHGEDQKILVAATQVVGGRVASDTYAAGSWLKACGVIGAADMTTPTAHAKLSWLLALNKVLGDVWSPTDLEKRFQQPLAGELTLA